MLLSGSVYQADGEGERKGGYRTKEFSNSKSQAQKIIKKNSSTGRNRIT